MYYLGFFIWGQGFRTNLWYVAWVSLCL